MIRSLLKSRNSKSRVDLPQARVAVIVRTKDRPQLLARALRSIAGQTLTDWHAVVVNDGGDPRAFEAASASLPGDIRAKITLLEAPSPHGRVGRNLNLGITSCSSEFITVHDDDDSWESGFLARSVETIEKEGTAATVCLSREVEETWNGQEYIELGRKPYNEWQCHGISLYRLAEGNTFPPIAICYRRSAWLKAGPYEERTPFLEDWVFNLKLFKDFDVSFLKEFLANYHFRRKEVNASLDRNSLVELADHFGPMDIRVRNMLLRDDLRNNRVGIGFLVNLANAHGQLYHQAETHFARGSAGGGTEK